MGPALALAARLVLSVVLAVSAATKLRAPRRARAGLVTFGLPELVASVLAPALPAVELATAALLLAVPGQAWPAWIAVALVAGFTVAVAVVLAGDRRPPCPCFGEARADPVSAATLVRDAWLLALGVVATGRATGAAPGGVAATAVVLGAVTLRVLRSPR